MYEGSKTVKTVFFEEFNSIIPPCSSIILETIDKPNPEPRCLLDTNGSKRWFLILSAIPGPLSFIWTYIDRQVK